MTGSRKERYKKEGTFLESVKSALEEMKLEISEIKHCVKGLQMSHEVSHFVPDIYAPIDGWNDWSAWCSLGFEMDPISAAANEHSNLPLPVQANNITIESDKTYGRAALMAYRTCESDVGTSLQQPSTCKAIPIIRKCAKCNQQEDQCLCFDIYCRRCLRMAQHCECEDPLTQHLFCAACDAKVLVDSLFDDNALSSMLDTLTCQLCGGVEFEPHKDNLEYFVLQGAHTCSTCGRVDAQGSLKACDGPCDTPHHSFCMRPVPRPPECIHKAIQFHQCSKCISHNEAVVCGDCLLLVQHSDADVISDESGKREQALSAFEGRMNMIMEFIEAADSGQVEVPKAVRDLIFSAAKDSYAWFQSSQPTEELTAKSLYLDSLMAKAKKRGGTGRQL